MIAQGILLIVLGAWLLFQTATGDLAGRIVSYGERLARG